MTRREDEISGVGASANKEQNQDKLRLMKELVMKALKSTTELLGEMITHPNPNKVAAAIKEVQEARKLAGNLGQSALENALGNVNSGLDELLASGKTHDLTAAVDETNAILGGAASVKSPREVASAQEIANAHQGKSKKIDAIG